VQSTIRSRTLTHVIVFLWPCWSKACNDAPIILAYSACIMLHHCRLPWRVSRLHSSSPLSGELLDASCMLCVLPIRQNSMFSTTACEPHIADIAGVFAFAPMACMPFLLPTHAADYCVRPGRLRPTANHKLQAATGMLYVHVIAPSPLQCSSRSIAALVQQNAATIAATCSYNAGYTRALAPAVPAITHEIGGPSRLRPPFSLSSLALTGRLDCHDVSDHHAASYACKLDHPVSGRATCIPQPVAGRLAPPGRASASKQPILS
jgi:hypothetical protein